MQSKQLGAFYAVETARATYETKCMRRNAALPLAALSVAPAFLFWGTAFALWLQVKLGLSTMYIGSLMDRILPHFNPHGADFDGLTFLVVNVIIFVGPVLAVCVLVGSMLQFSVSAKSRRVQLKIETRWLDGVDFSFAAVIAAVGACELLWLIPHAFLDLTEVLLQTAR